MRPVPLLAGIRLTARPAGASPRRAQADVTIYTDGACSGNPGPGGWAAIIIDGGEERVVSGAAARSRGGLMVLATVSGVIAAAEAGGGVEVGAIARVLGLSLGFLMVAVTLGKT